MSASASLCAALDSAACVQKAPNPAPDAEFAARVTEGLSARRKTLPCKFFYDAEGSRLFDRICELPEYYLTRTEFAILRERSADIAARAGADAALVEFGSGSGVKVRLLLASLQRPYAYVPIDISREHMLAAADSLAHDFPALKVMPVCADYTATFSLPAGLDQAAGRRVGFFPGSTIGNFTPVEACAFLQRARRLLGGGALMIVGVDVPKAEAVLHAAYDDDAGVTAAFNLNLLRRINRELQGTFDIEGFAHEARWNAEASRVEMHLVSRRRQTASAAGECFQFAAGETIHTESSYKYGVEQFQRIAQDAGWQALEVWRDTDGLFSVHVLQSP